MISTQAAMKVPLALSQQVILISAAVNGYLDDLPVALIKRFEVDFFQFMLQKYPQVAKVIEDTGDLAGENADILKTAVEEFKAGFIKK